MSSSRAVQWLGWGIGILLVLSVGTFIARGANRPLKPVLLPADAAVPSAKVKGFDEVAVRVRPFAAAGSGVSRVECDLLAYTEALRDKGLMGRTDLAGYDGMVFAFPADTTTPFWMRNTPMALSIAWFDGHGVFEGSANMAPCADLSSCPPTNPPGPYRLAIEVPAGGLPRLGLINGTAITVGGPCPIIG